MGGGSCLLGAERSERLGVAGSRNVEVEVVVQLCEKLWGRERELRKKGRIILKHKLFGPVNL
jgi:hypothetical protein